MKCTECGSMVRPVVALDIDGTLGDYHTHFILFLENYIGYRGGGDVRWKGEGSFRSWAMDFYEIDQRTWRDAKLAYRQGAQKRTMPIYSGAAVLCGAVRAAGAELWLTTTRPYLRLDNIDPDTRFWLERHQIKYDYLIYDEEKYSVLSERVEPDRVVAVVDDQIEQVLEAERVFGVDVPILKVSPWNVVYKSQGIARLEEIQDVVVARVNKWRMDNE